MVRMSSTLSHREFMDRCRSVLAPLSLMPLAELTASALEPLEPRWACYFNPHGVSTRVLAFPADARSRIVQTVRAWAEATAATTSQAPALPPEESELTGIPDGRSSHQELYFDSANGRTAFGLHRAGMSFRVRVTMPTAAARESACRVLMILTRHPVVVGGALPAGGQDCADASDTATAAGFGALRTFSLPPLATQLTPSIAHCFVAHLPRANGVETLLDTLSQADVGAPPALARLRKESIKFPIVPWHQNPRSGEMRPGWAYAALDHIRTEFLHSARPLDRRWHELDQIELEVGPHPELARVALGALPELDRRLESLHCRVTPAFGRKIHRMLIEQGVLSGRAGA
jgi:hypothetical protein